VTEGTNRLIGMDPAKLKVALDDLEAGRFEGGRIPELWDGKAAGRIIDVLLHGAR